MLKPITLRNGLTVLRFPKSNSEVFSIGFVCNTGSSVEGTVFPQGISNFVERLFWCGTDKHPSKRSLNLTLESLGGQFLSRTTYENTQFFITVPKYNQFKAVSMMAEIIQRSYFDSQDIEAQKQTLLENLKEAADNLQRDPDHLVMSNLYADTHLERGFTGTMDSVNSINQSLILEYISRQYHPTRSYLVLAGNFENKPLIEMIDNEWGVWNPRQLQPVNPLEFNTSNLQNLPRIVYHQKGFSSTFLSLGFVLDEGKKPFEISRYESLKQNPEKFDSQTINKPDIDEVKVRKLNYIAKLNLLNTILGQGFSSRLWSKCVEEELLFSQITSRLREFTDTGFLQVYGLIENLQFTFGLESIFTVIESLKKTTISINELLKAKEFLKGQLILENEDILADALWTLENQIQTTLDFELKDLLDAIDRVEAPEIRTLAEEIFSPKRLAITTLGTAKETRIVDKLIQKYL